MITEASLAQTSAACQAPAGDWDVAAFAQRKFDQTFINRKRTIKKIAHCNSSTYIADLI